MLGRDLDSGKYSRTAHVAQLHKLLGPLPEALRVRADKGIIAKLYTSDGMLARIHNLLSPQLLISSFKGQFKHSDLVPPDTFNLKSLTHSLAEEEKVPFLEFASKMLRWIPEERTTAEDLYNDPWLIS